MPVVIEHSGPPPYSSGDDWASYFREYRAGLDAKAAEKAERERRIRENGKFRVVQPATWIEIPELGTGPKSFANLLAKSKADWMIFCQQTRTHHDPTVYLEDSKSKNENDEKEHVAGDIRYPEHDEIHQSVQAALDHQGEIVAQVWAYWTQKIKADGAAGSWSFQNAKTFIRGIGWDYYSKATEFAEWQYILGLKPRPEPKEEDVWHG